METMLLDCSTIIFWAKNNLKHMRKLLQDEQTAQHKIKSLQKYITGIEHDLTELQKYIEKFYNACEGERLFDVERKQFAERFLAG